MQFYDNFMHYLFSYFIHTGGSSVLWHTCTLCMPCFILWLSHVDTCITVECVRVCVCTV